MLIKYDNINKKYPYFKFYLDDDENFVFDTNLFVIDQNPNNQYNRKIFYIIDENPQNVISYMYYNNVWKFRKSVRDFSDIDNVSVISLFIPEFNILSFPITIIKNTRFYLGNLITPPVEINNNRFFIGDLITPPVEINNNRFFIGDYIPTVAPTISHNTQNNTIEMT